MASSPTRTCPSCGARNNDRSQFCAECGVALGDTPWNDGDLTQAFEPVRTPEPAWSQPGGDQRTASGGYPAASTTPRPYASFDAWSNSPASETALQPVESSRGFWLGVTAWLLIAAVFVLYLWAAVLGEQFKDDIRDIVPGLAWLVTTRP